MVMIVIMIVIVAVPMIVIMFVLIMSLRRRFAVSAAEFGLEIGLGVFDYSMITFVH